MLAACRSVCLTAPLSAFHGAKGPGMDAKGTSNNCAQQRANHTLGWHKEPIIIARCKAQVIPEDVVTNMLQYGAGKPATATKDAKQPEPYTHRTTIQRASGQTAQIISERNATTA